MNNKQMQFAIELSKQLNFSAAAEKIGISQPALSKQISALEKELGVDLFDRTTFPISLTAAGEHFVKVAEDLLYSENQLLRSMEDFKSGLRGSIEIGVSPFRSMYLIPDLCRKVRDKYPGVKIVLHEMASDALRKAATEGCFDFAIANLPVDESLLDVLPIEQDKLVLAVPTKMLHLINKTNAKEMSPINFKDCSALPFVVVGQGQEMRTLFNKICVTANLNPEIAAEVVGLATAWKMTHAGVGATLLPLQFIESMNKDESITLFIPEGDISIRQPAIITRHGQHLSEYAKYAIEILKNQ